MYFATRETVTRDKMNSIAGRLSVVGFGALGDGLTNDTAAIQACLAAAVTYGLTAYVPDGAGSYMIDSVTKLQMNTAGMRLELAAGAVLQAIGTATDGAAVIIVTAADCSIEGGTIIGELLTHIGSTGEHNHGIMVYSGADRCRISNMTIKQCWGDGIYIGGALIQDTSIVNVICSTNRRNGLSITGSNRCSVIGGSFISNGTTSGTAPKAGIDVEPNPSSSIDVTDFTIVGANCSDNGGPGIQITKATGQVTRGTVTGCTCRGNSGDGILTAGSAGGIFAVLADNYCIFNILAGLKINAGGVQVNGGYYYGNTDQGVYAAANFNMSGGAIHFNSKAGLTVTSAATSSSVTGVTIRDNCWGAATTYNEVDITGANFWMTGTQVRPAGSGNRAIYAIKVQTGATIAKFFGVTASTGTTGIISPLGDTVQSPAVA